MGSHWSGGVSLEHWLHFNQPPVQEGSGGLNYIGDYRAEAVPQGSGASKQLCMGRAPAHGRMTPGDLAQAGWLLGANLTVFPSLSKKPKMPIHCTFLSPNLSALRSGLPGCAAAVRA